MPPRACMSSLGAVFLLVLITHADTQLDQSPQGKFFISSSTWVQCHCSRYGEFSFDTGTVIRAKSKRRSSH